VILGGFLILPSVTRGQVVHQRGRILLAAIRP
jgi:hypothetical protein